MIQPNEGQLPRSSSRREFLKTTMAVAAGAAAVNGLSLAQSAHAAGSDIIRIGMVGCGGRWPGAAINAMNVDPGVRLVAMADIFPGHMQNRREMLKNEKPKQVEVDDAHCFSRLDGYKHVIESVDVVLIACSAKYHPVYTKAAIEAGKHVFVEKPHAIDPVGVRQLAVACELAKQKKLSIVSGLHSRFSPGFRRPSNESTTGQSATSSPSRKPSARPVWADPRDPKLNEVEFQFNNQIALLLAVGRRRDSIAGSQSGPGHVGDEGTDARRAHGMGGRSASFGEIYGNVFDHHSVVYEYANGVRMYALCRTQLGCFEDSSSIYFGTKGRCNLTACRIEEGHD